MSIKLNENQQKAAYYDGDKYLAVTERQNLQGFIASRHISARQTMPN